MSKILKNQLIASFIFIFLIVTSSLFVKPIYNVVDKKINDITKIISTILVDKAEIKVTYKNLSPSILSSFSINEIHAYDADDNRILTIDRAKISYNLNKVFTGNINQIVKAVNFEGVELYGANLENYLMKIIELYSNPENKNNIISLEEILEMVEDFIPQNVYIKNLSADYENKFISASTLLKKINLSYQNKKAIFEMGVDGNIEFSLPQLNLTFTGDISLDSGLFPENNLKNSYANISFDNFTDGKFYLTKTNLKLLADDNQIILSSAQNTYPMNFNFTYDLLENKISGGLDMTDFYLPQLVSVGKVEKKHLFSFTEKAKKTEEIENQVSEIFSKVKNICMTLAVTADYDVGNNRIAYNSSGSFGVPSDLIPGGATAVFSLFGNDKRVSLPTLNISGNNYFASADLSFIFDGLQLTGVVEIPFYNLPNGNVFSTEIYIDTLESGYMAFSPQLFIGDNSLTALQVNIIPLSDSVDFSVEISDYSHIEEAEPGVIKLDGSYLYDSKYVQSSLSLNSLFADTLVKIVTSVVDRELSEKINSYVSMTTPYMLSADGYVSSDLKSISYNIPYVLLADTKKDNVALMVAVNGNEQSIQINQLNLVYGQQSLSATASLDIMPDSSDMFFVCDFSYGSVPYHMSGNVMQDFVSLTGDYGADFQFSFNKKNFGGHIVFDNLPIQIQEASVAFSLDADFSYDELDGPSVQINRLVMEETGSMFTTNPIISMAGNVTKYGAQFSSISFTDQYSTLEGYSDISVNMANKTFDSAMINLDMRNPISQESITSNITLSTPVGAVQGISNILSSLYVDCQIQFMNFSLNRFSSVKNDDNEINMSVFMTGPIDHPYVTLNIDKMSMIIGGLLAKAQGTIFVEDHNILINDFLFDYQGMKVKDVAAEFSLDDFKGYVDATFYADMMGRTANIPLHFQITDSFVEYGKMLPVSLSAELSSKGMSGTMIKKPVEFSIGLMYINKNISFYSSENMGLYGSYGNNGDLFLNMNSNEIIKMEAAGHIKKDDISIKFSNINMKLEKIISYFNFDDLFDLKSGTLQGSILYTEKPDGPEFKGAVSIVNPVLQIPMFIPYDVKTDRVMLLLNGNEIRLAESLYSVKNKHHFKLSGGLFLNKWIMDHAEASLFTVDKEMIPIKYEHAYFTLDGEMGCNVDILLEESDCNISGSVLCENLLLKSSLTDVTKRTDRTEKPEVPVSNKMMNVHMDVGLKLGTHAMINFDPLLRCIFVPNTSVRFLAELEDNYFDIKGNLGIKSGDISYLNRNFYIKEGNVKFNSDNLFNPSVTIKAETREKDDKGENIRIIISAENQLLLDFEPKFSSVPSRSESEIRMLLGQIVIGDRNKIDYSSMTASQNAVQFASFAGDYALQSTVLRGVENKLRNLTNTDIFSVRTNILQNSVDSYISENKIGLNMLNDSSLYMGRYFGEMLYFDAMLSLNNMQNSLSSNGSLFDYILPEFGIELDIPVFGNINNPNLNISSNLRWSMSPDLSALKNNEFRPNSSVTLSWKFSF